MEHSVPMMILGTLRAFVLISRYDRRV